MVSMTSNKAGDEQTLTRLCLAYFSMSTTLRKLRKACMSDWHRVPFKIPLWCVPLFKPVLSQPLGLHVSLVIWLLGCGHDWWRYLKASHHSCDKKWRQEGGTQNEQSEHVSIHSFFLVEQDFLPRNREDTDLVETRRPVAPSTSTVTPVPEGRSTAPRDFIWGKEELRTDSCEWKKKQLLH